MTSVLLACAILVALTCNVRALSSSWRPIVPSHAGSAGILHQEASIFGNAPTQTLYDVDSSAAHHLLLPHDQETCSLYKVAMSQQLYFEVHPSACVACIVPSSQIKADCSGQIGRLAIITFNDTSRVPKLEKSVQRYSLD